jgi:hypothetical protein
MSTAAVGGMVIDEDYEPVPLGVQRARLRFATANQTYVMRATVADESAIEAVRALPEVVNVWKDTVIAPFPADAPAPFTFDASPAAGTPCPIPPCDCTPAVPKGTMADVANYLGVSQIWAAGYRGSGIVVGVVDGGITAQGRPVKAGETANRIPRVIGGWPVADWGTEASRWGEHGNMTSTDVLGMAPEAQIYDLRISESATIPGTISRALQAFQWAITQHQANGTPQILSNSWGIFQESWDPTYASDPNHPFTRKVIEVLDEGIIVLFAAGNCGGTCPDNRCGNDSGPGRSIWGANSHPRVITVGAVNTAEQFVGYSSQGPGALDPNKPDFCSITHFTGYFNSDSGTSAATPILAGAVATIKQAAPTATQDSIKDALKATAKDIGAAGFDQNSGAGIVQVKAAFDTLTAQAFPGNWTIFYDWGCDGSYGKTTMTFNANGTWSSGEGYNGLWMQAAGMILFTFNNSETTYAGNMASKSVTGIATTFSGLDGCFYMLQAGVPTTFDAQLAAGQADSKGRR